MEIIKIEFTPLESHFGRAWLGKVPGFNAQYAIWINRETGKTIVSDPRDKKSTHNSIDSAKDWCQSDFELRVKNLLTADQTLTSAP